MAERTLHAQLAPTGSGTNRASCFCASCPSVQTVRHLPRTLLCPKWVQRLGPW